MRESDDAEMRISGKAFMRDAMIADEWKVVDTLGYSSIIHTSILPIFRPISEP